MNRPFEIQTVSALPGAEARFRVVGSLDANTSQRLREEVVGASARGHVRVVADLSEVDFLASTGIGTLLLLTETLKKTAQEFVILSPSEAVSQVIGLLNLGSFLSIETSDESAKVY